MKPNKTVNVTFSIPVELNNALHTLLERRGLSRFVAESLEKALLEKKNALRQAYIDANNDPDRNETIRDWEVLDVEGWDE